MVLCLIRGYTEVNVDVVDEPFEISNFMIA